MRRTNLELPAKLFLGATLLFAVAACQSQEPPQLSDADRAAIEQARDSAMAIVHGSGNWVDFAEAYFAPDAVLMPPNQEAVEGQDAIVGWMDAQPPIQNLQLQVQHEEGSPEVAYVQGNYTISMMGPGAESEGAEAAETAEPAESGEAMDQQPITDHGKYLAVWRKQMGGEWKVAFFIFNSNLPGEESGEGMGEG